MRLSYQKMKEKFLRNIQSVGSTDADLLAEFNYQLGVYYQLMLAKLKNYKTYTSTTFTTVANSQYINFPPGFIDTDGMVITVGSVNYPLQLVSSEFLWEQLNAITIQASVFPQYYFPRRDDFGIWPIPQDAYTGHIYYHYRDRNLGIADYAAGSITVTSNSAAIVGVGTVFTAAMVGRWLFIDDPAVPGQGYEYRISAFTDTTHITLARTFIGTTTAGITQYRIGETPEIPEEGHMVLVDGVTGGYYKDVRHDLASAGLFLNSFWTGDVGNTDREEGDRNIAGGLIGLMNRYADRDDPRVINRKIHGASPQFMLWGRSIS